MRQPLVKSSRRYVWTYRDPIFGIPKRVFVDKGGHPITFQNPQEARQALIMEMSRSIEWQPTLRGLMGRRSLVPEVVGRFRLEEIRIGSRGSEARARNQPVVREENPGNRGAEMEMRRRR